MRQLERTISELLPPDHPNIQFHVSSDLMRHKIMMEFRSVGVTLEDDLDVFPSDKILLEVSLLFG